DEERVKTVSELYEKLQMYYDVGKKVAVLIDEANMLRGKDIMEEIRGLLNIETQSIHLVNFVLFGLPEMEENLKQDEALYQRIAIRTTLNPLGLKSVQNYIVHRIKIAGGQNIPFTDKSFGLIHNYSGGKPRLVNIICENALLEGFLEKKKEIDSELINVVLTDLALMKSEND
ncbi:AAA family ATPase, partial [candidate division WOR-3 bacterium]|nr:AAA family ATPase [candidate division WOR-3 bacterium]